MTAAPPPPPPNERATPGTTAAAEPQPQKRSPVRRVLVLVVALLVLAAVAVGVVLVLTRGDGTKPTANPLEVRRLVATFGCTPADPTTPENLRLTPGQEVVRVPYAGCAVVGEVVGRVDRLEKVERASGNPCTVTLSAPEEYARIVDAASNVADGQVRVLVAGGQVLDVRAVLGYPGRPSRPLSVVFRSPDPADCTAVATALALR